MNKMLIRIRKITSIFLVLILSLFINGSFEPSISIAESEKLPEDILWSEAVCPIDISTLDEVSFLEKDFSLLETADYEDYLKEYTITLRTGITNALAEYLSEEINEDITPEIIEKIVDNADLSFLNDYPIDINYLINLRQDILICYDNDLEMALSVERVRLDAEYQAFITNTLVIMLTELKDKLAEHRVDQLEPEVVDNSNSTNTVAVNPLS